MAGPKMVPVKSSNIKAVGYDAASRALHVQFSSGTYAYQDVPPEKHAALMAAESIGKHVHAHIKGKHTSAKLDD